MKNQQTRLYSIRNQYVQKYQLVLFKLSETCLHTLGIKSLLPEHN